ncbi:hypothetical protein ACN47E_003445 [Coniothyrium glycines]
MWNPIYAIAPFALILLSIPLALFAIVTTTIGVTLLSSRALIVYFQLATALISEWIYPASTERTISLPQYPPRPSPVRTSPMRHHSRQISNGSNASQDTITTATRTSILAGKSDSLTALVGMSDFTQDFEGVGGWRVTGDDEEEALWIGGTPRTQLPVEDTGRRHRRSLTGGASPSQRWISGSEVLRMSPVQSRARTPLRIAIESDGSYFPSQPVVNIEQQQQKRKKSHSGSSTTSGIMMAVKEVGE